MDSEILSHAAELRDIYSTLHLVYYRNRNQHRNCKWWKWLSILKRSTSKLIKDIEELDDNIEIDVEGRLKARTRHLRSQVVPRCYLYVTPILKGRDVRLPFLYFLFHFWEIDDLPGNSQPLLQTINFRRLALC